MPVLTIPLGPLETNCYIVSHGAHCVVVDAGGVPDAVWEVIHKQKFQLQAILITHLHFDHIYGIADLQQKSGAPVYAPTGDASLMQSELGQGGMWGFPKVAPFTSKPLTTGEHHYGDIRCHALHTPGHTPGSISLYFPDENAVCAGDVLFYRSVGRSDFPGGDHDTLMRSIKEQLFTLPDATIVYPGHGAQTTIGDEKANNPHCGAFAG